MRGVSHFVGRQQELVKLHEHLQNPRTVAISAVAGMGGVGKTELATQYANQHEADYPGGICWLNARGTNLAAEIIQIFQLYTNLQVPQKVGGKPLTLQQQVEWCWQNWQPTEGLLLLVFDDVTDLDDFRQVLPTANRFRVLLTTRLRNLDANIQEISLDLLSPADALQLLQALVGERANSASELCEWLGYLPLGLELVGRYLREDPDLSVAQMLQRLKDKRLEDEALQHSSKSLSTAQLGVQAAFELTWQKLDANTQTIAQFLSLFALDVIPWVIVEKGILSLDVPEEEVNRAKKQLYQRHLIQRLEEKEACYKIHPLIREFLQSKLADNSNKNDLKQAFTAIFVEIAQQIPQSPTLEKINSVQLGIPHLAEVAENHLDVVADEDIDWVFIGLGRFYEGQGLYALAEPWYTKCLEEVRSRLGENHSSTATSLNDLAALYKSQGRYEQAEPLYIQALELRKRILGENHRHTATSLNNLALLYCCQGRYEQAEPLYIQALELRKRILGKNHPDTAQSLNNLALLYDYQGRYDEAEPLLIQALEIQKRILGENHPNTATILNNLAVLYKSQGRYDEAEPLYIQSLELRKRILGENHPDTATSLNNLAYLYYYQGRYDEAEPLYIKALEIYKRILGENHPDTALSMNNLAVLYDSQGRYDQAEPLLIQALEIKKRILGENHPSTKTTSENLEIMQEERNKEKPWWKRLFGK